MNPFVYIILAIISVVVFTAYYKIKDFGSDQEKWIDYLMDNDRLDTILLGIIVCTIAFQSLEVFIPGWLSPSYQYDRRGGVPGLFLLGFLVLFATIVFSRIIVRLISSGYFIKRFGTSTLSNARKNISLFYMGLIADVIFLLSGLILFFLPLESGVKMSALFILCLCYFLIKIYTHFSKKFLIDFSVNVIFLSLAFTFSNLGFIRTNEFGFTISIISFAIVFIYWLMRLYQLLDI